jgi:hypothetical protein
MSYDSNTGIRDGQPFEFKAAAAETASTTHAVAHLTGASVASITVKVTAASGTTPTLLVTVEGSDDGSTWYTLGQIGANGSAVGATATAPTNFTTSATGRGAFVVPEFIRTRSTIGGTTPSFTYSVEAVLS